MKQLTEQQMEQAREAVNALVEANLKPSRSREIALRKYRKNMKAKTIKLSKPTQQIFAAKLCIDEPRVSDVQWAHWKLCAIMHTNNIPVRFPVKLEENFRE